MNGRSRLTAFLAIAVLLAAATTAFVWVTVQQRPAAAPSSGPRLEAVRSRPHLVFRSADSDAGTYGRVAVVPLDEPAAAPVFTEVSCDRVDAVGSRMLCVRPRAGGFTGFEAEVLGADGSVVESWPLPGVPSRARLSPDGSMAATTAFVTGHSYAGAAFSTATEIREVGGPRHGNLESFTLRVDGEVLRAPDVNFWGVTFAGDGRTFFATAASGGRTWLVRGDLRARTLTAVRENAECPSLSPDGTRVAYKRRVDDSTRPWEAAVLDLGSGRETVLPQTRGLDDQLAWLDEDTLLYGLARTDSPGASDVWSVAADGESAPKVLIADAWSPAVVR